MGHGGAVERERRGRGMDVEENSEGGGVRKDAFMLEPSSTGQPFRIYGQKELQNTAN